jgi:hypothetical protein
MTLHPKIFDAQLPSVPRDNSEYQVALYLLYLQEELMRLYYFKKWS